MRRNIRIRLGWAAAVLCALAIAGCSHHSGEEAGGETARADVTLARIARADISQTLTLTGTAAALPNQDVRVSALVPGRITELKVAEGDRVQSGEVVAKVDDRPYRDQLQQAEAESQRAKANSENAQLALARNEDLFQRGIAARKDLEDARTQASVAAAALRQAEAALELAQLQLGRAEVHSPLAGQVVKRFASVGEQVDGTAAQPIVEIAGLGQLEFLGNSPAMYLSKLRPGEAVDVTTEAVPGGKFAGHVVAISPAVDPATGVGLVRIRVPNSSGLLRLGMFLTADVPVETHTRALVVPPEAIYRDEAGRPRVFVVNGDSATAVPVELGIETKESIELLSGVQEGQTVILTGGYGLGDKANIRVRSQAQP
ncbi:MAG TPA: efflux RND transporter periplasmic adaptor subunit [Candidatus Polarisedimenticolia bacterium]|nr:efflux RND transporter periplasmic adaptor subunit [Candidatus Polarisedimenticolia bacterium]